MVSKNNRYLKDVLQADKTQHWSLRKLGIGVTSVLLGTTFYLGGNTVAHADQTTPAAPTDNGGQVTQANQAETGNTAVLRSQPQAAAQTQSATSTSTTPAVASASVAPVTSAPTSIIAQSAAPTSAVQSATNSTAAVNSSVATNSVAGISDATQSESTTTLNIKSGAVSSQAPAVAQSLAENDQNQSQTQWADMTTVKLIKQDGKDLPTTNDTTFSSWDRYDIQGNFSIDSKYLKKGNVIDLATFDYSSSNKKFIHFVDSALSEIKTNDGQTIGQLFLSNLDSNGRQTLYVNVTNNVKLLGKATLSFTTLANGNNAGKLQFNYQSDKRTFLPLSSSDKYPYTESVTIVNHSNQEIGEYTFNFTHTNFPNMPFRSNFYGYVNNGWANGISLDDFTFNSVVPNAATFKELLDSNGQKGNVNLSQHNFYYRINVENQDGTVKSINDPQYNIGITSAHSLKYLFASDDQGNIKNDGLEILGGSYTPKR